MKFKCPISECSSNIISSLELRMKLPRTTICVLFEIKAPIWGGGHRKVGLALHRIRKHNEIHFTYRRRFDGKLSFPDVYYFDGDLLKGLDYEVQTIKGTNIVLIPFSDLEVLERI